MRIPLAADIESRDGTLTAGALIVNRRQEAILSAGYDEKDQQAFLHFGVRAAIGPAIGMPSLSGGQSAALAAYAAVCLAADTAAGDAYAALGL